MSFPLAVENVFVHYDKKQILHDVSFEIEEGEIFGLIGLNGAGKTTLIRTILGLTKGAGNIRLFDEQNHNHKSREKLIYMPELLQPSPLIKGWEYLSLILASYSMELNREKAVEIAGSLAFDAQAFDNRINTYSKGMGQKLGLISVFLTGLPFYILDEPMSGLDPLSRVKFKDALIAENKKGSSIFFSSHILADIEEICSRIGVMHKGRIIYLGKPDKFIKDNDAVSLERAFLNAITSIEEEK